MRITTGSAFDGRRLAVVGGTEGEMGTGDASLTRSDGAIYDIDSDRWDPLPDLPWAGVHPGVAWMDSTLVVAGGEPDLEMGPDDGPDSLNARVVQLSDDGGSWVELASAPEFGATVSWPSAFELPGDGEPVVQQYSFIGVPSKPEGAALIDGSWEATPTESLHRWRGDWCRPPTSWPILATSRSPSAFVEDPTTGSRLRKRRSVTEWRPASQWSATASSWWAV